MMIFNPKKSVPYVPAGNVGLGLATNDPRANAFLQKQAQAKQALMLRARAAAVAKQKQISAQNELAAQKQNAMLQRSLRQGSEANLRGMGGHSLGFVPSFGVYNPLVGFVDANTETDYAMEHVVPAQEFSNQLASKDFPDWTKFHDYPWTIDSPNGDFGGFLTNEAGSADFSHFIVHNEPEDFGRVDIVDLSRPNRRR